MKSPEKKYYLKHIGYRFRDKELQEKVESDCSILIESYFPDDSYAIEKFLKMYVEPIIYLESMFIKEEEELIDKRSPSHVTYHMERVTEKNKARCMTEAKRQFSHATTFLSALKIHNTQNKGRL